MLFEKAKLIELKAPAPVTRYVRLFFDDAVIPDAPLSLACFRFEPGQFGPRHVHEKQVEVYYCLHGRGLVVVDGEEFILNPHSALYIPPGKHHETRNIGDSDFEFLGIFGPCLNFDNFRKW
jgi:mannose-6-phosphate isomerase-like protein (cupin superfamily)